ncbi:MAG: hypothetical protein JOZ78_07550 [Chroococcidiopsidaceae cyanobacterium CP_BM_ER_R8_30]|nr:hypothetical protein [Chroococcidiopsidaceae cyanobacterium CP_BM_ER_R8_30]
MKHFTKTFQQMPIARAVRSYSNKFNAYTLLFKEQTKFLVPRLFTIRQGAVFRLTSVDREIQVLSGVAWLTVAGEDIILTCKEKAFLELNQDFAIVSALSNVPLLLVAWSGKQHQKIE